MEHPLERFLSDEGLTTRSVAVAAGVSESTICSVFKGRRKRFSPEAAARLSEATQGRVTVEQLLGLKTSPRRRPSKPGKAARR